MNHPNQFFKNWLKRRERFYFARKEYSETYNELGVEMKDVVSAHLNAQIHKANLEKLNRDKDFAFMMDDEEIINNYYNSILKESLKYEAFTNTVNQYAETYTFDVKVVFNVLKKKDENLKKSEMMFYDSYIKLRDFIGENPKYLFMSIANLMNNGLSFEEATQWATDFLPYSNLPEENVDYLVISLWTAYFNNNDSLKREFEYFQKNG